LTWHQTARWQSLPIEPADAFERFMVPPILEPLARVLVDATHPRPGERVLDLACGTGIVARVTLDRIGPGGAVVGVDIDPSMLAIARARSDRMLDLVESDAAHLPFGAGVFDVVMCQHGLPYFEQRREALLEARRVLRQQGRLGIVVWSSIGDQPVFAAIGRALTAHGDRATGLRFFATPSSLGGPDTLRSLLSDVGFRTVELRRIEHQARFPSVRAFLEQYAAASGFGDMLAALAPASADAVIHAAAGELAGLEGEQGTMLPMTALLAVATR
jgi:ubiquinone/menaquinone biosynthesis C-methylase UbiE